MGINFSDLEGLHCGYVSRYVLNHLNKGTVKPVTKFTKFESDNFKLPVEVSGRLITAGTYFEPKYGMIETPADELKKVHSLWVGKDIFKYHDAFWQLVNDPSSVPANDVVGRIIRTTWNEADQAIDYVAQIFDRDVAYKIYSRLIKHVSVGFGNDVDLESEPPRKFGIEPQETSLVYRPRDPDASVGVTEISF